MKIPFFYESFAVLVFLFMIAGLAFADGSIAKLPMRNEASDDPSFHSFYQKFKKAVMEKDSAYLRTAIFDSLKHNFGPSGQTIDLKRLLGTASPFWNEMKEILNLGGTFMETGSKKIFCAPYVYSAFPSDIDGINHRVIITENTKARAAPRNDAAIVRELSFNIVRTDPSPEVITDLDENKWVMIYLDSIKTYVPPKPLKNKLDSSNIAFVPITAIRGPSDTRACFSKINGRWLLTSFINGD